MRRFFLLHGLLALMIMALAGCGGGSSSSTSSNTPALQSITVGPASASITVGATQPFTATGHYSDSSTQNLTSSATWTSSVPTDATIAAGLADGVAAGSTKITATLGSVTSRPAAVLAVTAAVTTGSGNTFYVSTAGNDSNPGTLASPWLTIQHAASTVQAEAYTLDLRHSSHAKEGTPCSNRAVAECADCGPAT